MTFSSSAFKLKTLVYQTFCTIGWGGISGFVKLGLDGLGLLLYFCPVYSETAFSLFFFQLGMAMYW